jgi:hypothetical protein
MGDKRKFNHLAAVEMAEEGNYNMIDGIINNSNKPSILEHMQEHERKIAANNRAVESHKSATSSRESL